MSSFNLWNIEWYRKNGIKNLDSKLEGAICNSAYNILCKSNNNFFFFFFEKSNKKYLCDHFYECNQIWILKLTKIVISKQQLLGGLLLKIKYFMV